MRLRNKMLSIASNSIRHDVDNFLTHVGITFKKNFEPGRRGSLFVSHIRGAIAYRAAPNYSS